MRYQDILIMLISGIGTIIAFIPFFWILFDIIEKGLPIVIQRGIAFLTEPPPLPGEGIGGIGTVLEGTLFMVGIGTLIAGPIGLFAGVYMALSPRSFLAKLGRVLAEVMVEFPTIIIGITVFLIVVVGLNFGASAIAGGIALSIIMVPYVTIQVSESLKIPKERFMEASYALGLSTKDVIRVLIGAGKNGILTGFLIGLAKIAGETAPLLFTTTTSFNLYLTSPTSPVSAIPVLIYVYAFSPFENWHTVAWGAAFVLTLIVLIIFVFSRIVVWRWTR
ncbi:MAG: PstA family ABC transporter permease [Thermoprotei archaeon]|jgi:phosphate transport system permease protein